MAGAHHDFVYRARAPVLWRKLALLDAAFYEQVIALLETHREIGEFAIERQTVPVGLLLDVAVTIPERPGLAQPHVRYGRPGPEKSLGGLVGEIPCDLNPVSHHDD